MGKGDQDGFAEHAASVGRELFGAENKQLSSRDELRWGNGGSMALDVKTGRFFDHEAKEGGGVLWLIERLTGQSIEGGLAADWMRERGYAIPDRPSNNSAPSRNGSSGAQGERQGPRLDPSGNFLPERVPDHAKLTKIYPYTDEAGRTVSEVCRYDWEDPSAKKGRAKTFVQRVPDSSKRHGYRYTTKGVKQVPYRLPELIEDVRDGLEIFMVEGEKKADILRDMGVSATCNAGGSGKFPDSLVDYFKDAKVTIIPDNDEAGEKHVEVVAGQLNGIAKRVRVLRLPGLPPSGSVDDWVPAGGTVEQLFELAEKAPLADAVTYKSKFGAVSWLDFDNVEGEVYNHLIEDTLTENELSLLLGESQSGKSFLAIDISMAVARGTPWFGKEVTRGGVVYQAGESARGVRRQRFPAYRKHYDVAREPLPVVLLQQPLDLYSSEDPTDAFIEECKHWSRTFPVPLRLIVIDTFNKATPGANENDGKDMGLVLTRCDRIRRETGAHVMLVHHLNAGGTKARGHTSLFANVENVITTAKVDKHHDADNRQIREWRLAKQKDGEDGVTERFVLPAIEIGTKPNGKPLTSCIVARPAFREGEDSAPRAGAMTIGEGPNKVAYRTLLELLGDDLIAQAPPPELDVPKGARVVERKLFSTRFYEVSKPDNFDTLSDDEKGKARERLKKTSQRAREYLFSKGLIGISDTFIWATGKPVMGFAPPPGLRRRTEDRPPPSVPEAFADDWGFE